jgi:hypothetical protein
MDIYLGIWAGLVGFGALISFIISILKYTGVVVDGTSDKWVAGFNLLGIVAVVIIVNFFPQVNLPAIDEKIMALVVPLNYIWSYMLTLLGSKMAYWLAKGLPVIGKSFSLAPTDSSPNPKG